MTSPQKKAHFASWFIDVTIPLKLYDYMGCSDSKILTLCLNKHLVVQNLKIA